MSDWRNTQTSRTSLFCKYRSFMVSHVDIQLEIQRCMNSEGNSTACNRGEIEAKKGIYKNEKYSYI